MNVWKYQELVLKDTWKVHSRLKIYLLMKNIKNRCNCEVYFFDHTGFKEGVIIVLSLESNEVRAFIRSDNKGYSVFRSFCFEF